MSIRAIRLRAFRGFRDATVDLKPLTVLLGPNSAGKSAWGHAVAAMAHAHSLYRASGDRLTLSPQPKDAEQWPIDLGSLSDLRTHGESSRVFIGLQTSEGWVEFGFGLPGFFDDSLRLTYVAHPYAPQVSVGAAIEIGSGQPEIPGGQSAVLSAGHETSEPPRLRLRRDNEIEWRALEDSERNGPLVTLDLEGLLPRTVQHAPGGTGLVLNSRAKEEVRSVLQRLTYLRASRQRPLRSYPPSGAILQEIGYGGERTAIVLNRRAGEEVAWLEPPPVPDSAGTALLDVPWVERRGIFLDVVGQWLGILGIAHTLRTRVSPRNPDELEVLATLEHQQPRDLTEIGFGVSQVLPVIVAGLLEQREGLFVVDLPEAHLHPRPQAVLADFFCSLALSGRSTLVETHSEMFFHRLRLRAEMNHDLRDKIAVYFIDPPVEGCCCAPRQVGVSFDDELRWPQGFLQEGWETESQINAVRQARQRTARADRSS